MFLVLDTNLCLKHFQKAFCPIVGKGELQLEREGKKVGYEKAACKLQAPKQSLRWV